MKKEQDYIRDIAEIRSMMERSSKFLSLSGWAGIMAGIYALAGAYIAYKFLEFDPTENFDNLPQLIILALAVFALAIATAAFLSYKKAAVNGQKLWNPTSKRLLFSMAIPLLAGGILILIFISHGLINFIAPFSLIFYGLAMFNAGRYTYEEVKFVGLVEIGLGLIASCCVEYGLFFWAIGFGIVHIIYGIYMHYKYEK
ncbi:MAG TPA: hypothetical protein VFM72_08715 [Aequorivita sp.]|nr:hypothetical protein [Aequorivita sp.]